MKTSARNQFHGTVSAYKQGAVNDEVEISLAAGPHLVAIVTHASGEALGLEIGASALALVKASSVILATGLGGERVSARNQFEGKIIALTPGGANDEVEVDIGSGLTLTAVVTRVSVQALALAVGAPVTAFFKASSVVLVTTT
jgi:molybdate transport system regulatory protein